VHGQLHEAGHLRVKRIQRIEMMTVLGSILLIVDYVSPILWTIGLIFLIIGIVLVVGEKSRGARGRRFRY
jgi:hypothetical protein